MTDTETTSTPEAPEEKPAKKPGHLRRQGMNYAKLVGAITALTAAVNGYLDLEKKNALVYQALASKVNNMATELAEVKGQNQVIMVFLARQNGLDEMLEEMGEVPTRSPASLPKPERLDDAGEEAEEATSIEDEIDMVAEVTVASEAPEPVAQSMNVDAYQELPANLDDLVQEQKQLQVQEE